MIFRAGVEYMIKTIEILREFSKTPLKHRMGKYLLDFILNNEDLLKRIVFVKSRNSLPNTMVIAQAGTEGSPFELELGVREHEEVSLVNGRLVKQTKKTRATWTHDPVEAVELLRNFTGKLHVELIFNGEQPPIYQTVVSSGTKSDVSTEFSSIIHEQIDLAILAITLKKEIDDALMDHDRDKFFAVVKMYNQVRENCLWQI